MSASVMFTTQLISNMSEIKFWDVHSQLCHQYSIILDINEYGHNGSDRIYFTSTNTKYDLEKCAALDEFCYLCSIMNITSLPLYENSDVKFFINIENHAYKAITT